MSQLGIGSKVEYIGRSTGVRGIGTIKEIKQTGINEFNVEFDSGMRWCSKEELQEVKGGGKKMAENRGLYQVVVVNPTEDGEVLLNELVIAKDISEAKFNAEIKPKLKEKSLKIGSVDIIVNKVGDVRPYAEEQTVKIVGGVGEYKLIKEAQ